MVSVGEGETVLGNWSQPHCNTVRGRDPGTLSINLDQDTPLNLYFPNMCRNMMFRFRKRVEVSGITTWRFVPADNTFHSPWDNPDNSCYCHDRLCLPSGIFDIGVGCKVTVFSLPFIFMFTVSRKDLLSTSRGLTSCTVTPASGRQWMVWRRPGEMTTSSTLISSLSGGRLCQLMQHFSSMF